MQSLGREHGRGRGGEEGGRHGLTVHRAAHPEVDAQDGRRCLLERHLQGRWEAREGDAEELASFGLAYLHRLPRGRMLTGMKVFVAHLARGSTRPGWTLLAISCLMSAVIVPAGRCAFGD